jgi:biopolymer transport protein ExbD
MNLSRKHRPVELPAGSMADIAFLLLTFYMVTTVIHNEKGITILLPPMQTGVIAPVHERNLFTVQINSQDQFLVEGVRKENIQGMREEIKKFIMNHGKNPTLSLTPEKAVVSFKTDRGTSYRTYIAALDEIQAAYYELYAQQVGISTEHFRKLDLNNPAERALYEKGRNGIPMNISIAESN